MNHESHAVFSLHGRSESGAAPVLVGVDAQARLDDLTFGLTLRQRYVNRTSDVLEVVYTFPLPPQACLLGFASELNGTRRTAVIVARHEAEAQYEDALAGGHAPVMLEDLGGGLHTANIGNLQPGDELTLEVRMASFVDLESGRLRLSIPSTIAPRYGEPGQAGLQPQQVPVVSLTAQYPLSLSLRIEGAMAPADVRCPTHALLVERASDHAIARLAPGAWLDRDLVFTLDPPVRQRSGCTSAADPFAPEAAVVHVASFELPARAPREGIALKVLVDCSGSMAGLGIASARAALFELLQDTGARDCVSVSRFGSTVDHPCRPARMSPDARQRAQACVGELDANMGGTDMEEALRAVFELESPLSDRIDVLLITDGEIWDVEGVAQAARDSGHRVFAIGVGAAAAEAVLREVAGRSGGACEFAAPGESLQAAARRMLALIRQTPYEGLDVDWGAPAQWQTPLPAVCYGGQTVRVAAGFPASAGRPSGVRLVQRQGAERSVLEDVRMAAPARSAEAAEALVRLAARRRLVATVRPDERAVLALRYQLLCDQTHAVLVHERESAPRVAGQARLVRIGSMTPAGTFGSSVRCSEARFRCAPLASALPFPRSAHRHGEPEVLDVLDATAAHLPPAVPAVEAALLQDLAETVHRFVADGGALEALADHCAGLLLPGFVRDALKTFLEQAADPAFAWLAIAQWWFSQPQARGARRESARWQVALEGVPGDLLARWRRILESGALGDTPSWHGSRLLNAIVP